MRLRLHHLGVLALSVAVSCVGEEEPVETPAPVASTLPAGLVAAAWPVRMADDSVRAPFEAGAGWGAYFQRDHARALAAFQAEEDAVGVQRVHADLAALYEQAALLGAHATEHAYLHDRQSGDPAETTYLVAVAQGLKGACDDAAATLASLSVAPPLEEAAASLSAWIDEGCAPLSAGASLPSPGDLGAVSVGTEPAVESLPHYTFAEQTDAALPVEAGDPAALARRAAWHRAAAREAGASEALLAQVLAPWTIAAPEAASGALDVSDGWLFGGFALSAADLGFLQDARARGLAAVESWAGDSLLAAALGPAVGEQGVDPQQVLEDALALRKVLVSAMESASGGPQGFHEPFAKLGQVALLRAGMVLADGNGQYRDAGILRINSLELSEGPGVFDPLFSVSVAAWDVGNRNPLRAQEILHRLSGDYPALGAARYPLDAMHIRLSRNAAPAIPVH